MFGKGRSPRRSVRRWAAWRWGADAVVEDGAAAAHAGTAARIGSSRNRFTARSGPGAPIGLLGLHAAPPPTLLGAALASCLTLALAAAAGWAAPVVALVALVPWLAPLALQFASIRRHFGPLASLHLLAVGQAAFLVADLAQVLRSEALHAAVGASVLVAALLLLTRHPTSVWLRAAVLASGAHVAAQPLLPGAIGGVDVALGLAATGVCLVAFARAFDGSVDRWLAMAFPHAPSSLLAELTRRLDTARFAGGDVVVAEGDPTDRFYIITAGEAEVTQLAGDGDVYLRTLGPGDFFGEVGLLRSVPRTATVRAVRSLEVVSLDRETFRGVVDRSDMTAQELARVLEERSRRREASDDAVPLPPWTRLLQRVLKHPRVMHYNRLIALVLAANLVLLGYGLTGGAWWAGGAIPLPTLALVAQANIALAIIFRQQYVVNFLGWLATRPPTTWPLRIRWLLGKYSHLGGLHVGAAVSGTLWYLVFVGSLVHEFAEGAPGVSLPTVVVSGAVVALLVVIVVMALPRLRAAAHDDFEVTHRFCGWAALVLVWLNTVLFVAGRRGTASTAEALLAAPTVWILLATTAFAIWPWLLLRRVPITVERPSSHVALVTLAAAKKPPIGTTRAISRHPLVGWHHFANVPARAGGPGYRMAVSRAGDWTGAFIDDPPDHVWVRGLPTVGVANVKRLFRKVVYVTTGSGIGPALGHLLANEVPSRLVWVTRDPRSTYGGELLDEIMSAQPDAIIWNTDERGKPDMLRLAYGAYLSSGAEAVICISNKRVTWRVVHGLERRGIPAFGPIWDS